MALATRHIATLVFLAHEARAMWAAAGTSDLVTPDAELLTRAAVATRARNGIEARRTSMACASASAADPSTRMRAPRSAAPRADALARMTLLARRLRVTRDAEAGLPARLERVSGLEARAMESGQAWIVEREPGGERRRRRAVTAGAVAIRVAGGAEIARARCARAVLTHEVAFVHDMAVGPHVLAGQVDVTAVARAHRELVLVLVATEARGHRR